MLRREFVFALVPLIFGSISGFAGEIKCPVGVNVNSFQNFTPAEQHSIVDQLKRAGVRFVRIFLRPDDKNMTLAKTLQSQGIGLLVVGPMFLSNSPLRPADPKRYMRSALPLSYADSELSKAYFQTVFDKLPSFEEWRANADSFVESPTVLVARPNS